MNRHFVTMSFRGWMQLREMVDPVNASFGQAIRELATVKLKRPPKDPGLPLVFRQRTISRGIALDQATIDRYRDIAQDLLLVSGHRSQEFVGLVVEAYVTGLIVGPPLQLKTLPIRKKKNSKVMDVYLSRTSWLGLKELYGPSPARTLNTLAVNKTEFVLTGTPVPFQRRHVHHIMIAPEALTYFGEYAQKLQLPVAARMGLISWTSVFLEYLGRGGVRDVRSDVARSITRDVPPIPDLVVTGVRA